MKAAFAGLLLILLPSLGWADDAVPVVGCRSDGQLGPEAAPKTHPSPPLVSQEDAAKLAYYNSGRLAVLAPRGWHCLGMYGSNGNFLLVAPSALSAKAVLSHKLHITGPGLELSFSDADTSGRYSVTNIAARVFPARKGYVQEQIQDGLISPEDLVWAPYPDDLLSRKSDNDLDYVTPSGKTGLGTNSYLEASDRPISGFASMDADNNLTMLHLRLPPGLDDLAGVIAKSARQQPQTPQ